MLGVLTNQIVDIFYFSNNNLQWMILYDKLIPARNIQMVCNIKPKP